MVAKREEGGKGMEWEFGVSRCKLVYIGWINNKVPLYTTGNYIQYPVINHNGKEYIYVHLNHFTVYQKLTQNCKSTMLQFLKFHIQSIKNPLIKSVAGLPWWRSG